MVGSDRVIRKGELVLIYSRVEMPDWQVRTYRRTAVVIDDRTYFVAQTDKIDRRSFRYVLRPWPEDLRDMPGKTVHYHEGYVQLRDQAILEARRRDNVFLLLRPLKPLIGLLPSFIKGQIEEHYGLQARSATMFSLWLELGAFFWLGTITWVFAYAALRAAAESGIVSASATMGLLVLGELLIILDMVMRFSDYLSDRRTPWGLLEWLFRIGKR